MLGNPEPNRPPPGVLQHFWYFARRREDKGIGSRCQGLNKPVGPIVDAGVDADFREIRTNQREIVVLVGAANSSNSVNRLLVTDLATKGIARIGRISDKSAALNIPNDHGDTPYLRVFGMNFDEFCHARIVGERSRRGYPHNTLLCATDLPGRRRPMSLLFEFLPLILFLGAFLYKGIYAAIIVLMIAMPIGLLIKYARTRTLDRMYFWSTVFLLVAGGLTLYFRNPLFLYWKPTAFYWVVAIAFLASQFIGDTPLVRRFFGLVDGLRLENITAAQWNRLNLIWVVFFVAVGFLNIYVAYNFEQATWVKFKVFGLMGITFVFMLVQTFWVAGIIGDDADEDEKEPN